MELPTGGHQNWPTGGHQFCPRVRLVVSGLIPLLRIAWVSWIELPGDGCGGTRISTSIDWDSACAGASRHGDHRGGAIGVLAAGWRYLIRGVELRGASLEVNDRLVGDEPHRASPT